MRRRHVAAAVACVIVACVIVAKASSADAGQTGLMAAKTPHRIRVGTASWTDKTLLASGWYPRRRPTPRRSGWPTTPRQFPLVEVDATYYAPPAEQTASAVGRAHPGRLPVQHQGVQPAHRAPDQGVRALQGPAPGDRQAQRLPQRPRPAAYEQVWARFLSALDPLVEAGKLGAILFQFPPWFTIRRSNKQYLLEVAKRCSPLRVAVEFRHESWFDGDNTGRDAGVPARAPAAVRLRGHAAGPQVVDPAGGRGHRRPGGGALPRPQRQVDQQGHPREVRLPLLRAGSSRTGRRSCASWPTRPSETHVLMNNCYSDYAQTQRGRPRRPPRPRLTVPHPAQY